MGTLADLKRRLIPGTFVECVWHRGGLGMPANEIPPKMRGVRKVLRNRSVDVTFELNDESGKESHLDWPRASCLQYEGDEFTVLSDEGTPVIRYRIVN